MRAPLHIIILVLGLTACEKDVMIDSEQDQNTLDYYLSQFSGDKISSSVWAQAGNHPSFERETDDKEVHVTLYMPTEAHSFVYFQSDSMGVPDSTQWYRKRNVDFESMGNGLLGRFLVDQPKHDTWVRVGFQMDDRFFISGPVLIRDSQTPTGNIEEVLVDVSATGRCDFRWFKNANINSVSHLLLLHDRTGDAFCGVYTRSLNFFFYDLRNVSQNLTPELYDPLLVLGEDYSVTISSIDEQGWIRDHRSFTFTADTNEVMVFGLE